MPIVSWWKNANFYIILLFMIGSLASYAYLGTFTRYMADDYCTAAIVKDLGFWHAQSYCWQNWSGRYSFTFIISLVELLGLQVVPIMPVFIILLWISSIVWVCLPLFKHLSTTNFFSASLFVACLALWLTYRNMDDYPQVVFWQTGILTYPISPILFCLGIGWAVRRVTNVAPLSWREILGCFLASFIASGFSETGAAMQIALITYLLVFVYLIKVDQKRFLFSLLWVTLLGSALSLLTMAIAPGNLVRSNGFVDVPSLKVSLVDLLKNVLLFIPELVDKHTMAMALGLLGGLYLAYCCIPEHITVSNLFIIKSFIATLLLAMVGILGGLAPAYLIRGVVPPERVLLFTHFLIASIAIYWGALCAMLLRMNLPLTTLAFQRWITIALFTIFIVWSVLPVVISRLQLIPPLQQYSETWDNRHEYLLSISYNHDSIVFANDLMKIEALRELRTKLWLTGDFETSPDYWINICAAQYYGADQVIAK